MVSEHEHVRRHRIIATWLFCVAAMVFVMVIVGGLTRLTESGLSIVDWRPVTGWLPPFSDAEWQRIFAEYRQYPEYQKVNDGMTLAEFKGIFWLEFIHRLWGRLIGLAFAVPFAVFLLRGWIERPLIPRLVLLFVLGGMQGVLGWYMVRSGLVDRPDVSQYRLVAHFGAALLIYGALLWVALGLLHLGKERRAPAGLTRVGTAMAALVLITALSGGFVAGTGAGYAYNTFPTMDGDWIPGGLFASDPAYLSLFEDVTTIQFVHRALAITTLIGLLLLWALTLRSVAGQRLRLAASLLAAAACAQAALGISTLVLIVPLALAALHQAGAVVVFTLAVWTVYELRSGRRTDSMRVPQPRTTSTEQVA